MPRQLYRYQDKAYSWAFKKSKIALFLEMRLGKTLIAIKWVQSRFNCKRILVICPLSVVPIWQRELSLEGIKCFQLNTIITRVFNGSLQSLEGWFITNYETITFTNLSEMNWDCVILDESTKIRNPDTKISRKCVENFKEVPFKAILTGTPAPESHLDYFNQLKFLYNEVLQCTSWWSFRNKYFHQYRYRGQKFRPRKEFTEVFKLYLADRAYILSRKQTGLGSKKIHETRLVEMDPLAYNAYKVFEKDWMLKDFEVKYAIVAYNYMRQMTGGYPKNGIFESSHKIKEVQSLLSGELKGEKIVLWVYHTKEIRKLYNTLKSKYVCTWIDCQITGQEREKRRLSFQNDAHMQILIAQIKTGSMGVDLSAADTVINYSKSYSCLDNLQLEDRVIHPEKKVPILFINLVTKGTIDEDIEEIIYNKKTASKDFLHKVNVAMQKRLLEEESNDNK